MGPLEAVILLCMVAWLPALLIAALKARWLLFAAGILLFPLAIVGALLPARERSVWARQRETFCPSCGSPTRGAEKACERCGHDLRGKSQLLGPERLIR